jgi:hypothetical protein
MSEENVKVEETQAVAETPTQEENNNEVGGLIAESKKKKRSLNLCMKR